MASSGQITVYTESVDWPNYTRGACTLTNVIGWSVNDSGDISFSSISSTDNQGGHWWVCTTSTNPNEGFLIMEVQVDYGGGWQTVASSTVKREVCPGQTNTISSSLTLIGSLGTAHLTGDCSMRILYYADLNPHPSADLPNAFPTSSYSAAVQVPVHVDVSWNATLNYDANGGTGAPSSQTHSQSSDSYTFTIRSDVPTRKNYRFDGWSTSSSASTPSYQPGDSFTVNKSNPTRTLYAVWTKFYHPGAVLDGNSKWMSHDRDSGACQLLSDVDNDTWTDLRTIDAPTGLGDPPALYHNSKWFNQRKLGKE